MSDEFTKDNARQWKPRGLGLDLLDSLLDLLLDESRREGLLELVSLLLVLHSQGVEIARATDLELDVAGVLLDGDVLGILTTSLGQKISHVCDILRHSSYAFARPENRSSSICYISVYIIL